MALAAGLSAGAGLKPKPLSRSFGTAEAVPDTKPPDKAKHAYLYTEIHANSLGMEFRHFASRTRVDRMNAAPPARGRYDWADMNRNGHPRAAGQRTHLQGLAPGSRLAHVAQQSGSEVAEKPDQLIVYGGTGRAARSWRHSTRLCAAPYARKRRDAAGAIGGRWAFFALLRKRHAC